MQQFTTFWGLISAYWRSERWKEALALTVIVFAMTTLLSKASVWTAMASADFLASLAEFHTAGEDDPAGILFLAAVTYVAIYVARTGGVALRHLFSATLHRRARGWMVSRFDAEILADERIAFDLMSDRADGGGASKLPDAIDQRVDECSGALYSGVIGVDDGASGGHLPRSGSWVRR